MPLQVCKSSFLRPRLSQVRRRVIREIFHGIGFLHGPALYFYYTTGDPQLMKNR